MESEQDTGFAYYSEETSNSKARERERHRIKHAGSRPEGLCGRINNSTSKTNERTVVSPWVRGKCAVSKFSYRSRVFSSMRLTFKERDWSFFLQARKIESTNRWNRIFSRINFNGIQLTVYLYMYICIYTWTVNLKRERECRVNFRGYAVSPTTASAYPKLKRNSGRNGKHPCAIRMNEGTNERVLSPRRISAIRRWQGLPLMLYHCRRW